MLMPLFLTSALALFMAGQGLRIKMENCTPNEQSILLTSIGKATSCLDTVLQIHDGTLPFENSPELRHRYFGDISDEDFLNVTSVYSRIQNNWGEEHFRCEKPEPTSNSSCNIPGAAAYAHHWFVANATHIPVRHTEVVACPIFLGKWQFDWLEHPPQRGTALIHEMIHLFAEPTAGDVKLPDGSKVAYGDFAAEQLAFWSWELAIRNADNIALYAQAVCTTVENGMLRDTEEIDTNPPDLKLTMKIQETLDEAASWER